MFIAIQYKSDLLESFGAADAGVAGQGERGEEIHAVVAQVGRDAQQAVAKGLLVVAGNSQCFHFAKRDAEIVFCRIVAKVVFREV